jgi:hypothetical protein
MFEQDTARAFIEAGPEEVLDVYNSINRSMVVVPSREPEKAQAFIASVYKENLYHAYIYLYLSVSNEGLLYRWSEGGVQGDRLNGVYQAALEFTESMGFMMDDMRYRDKTPEEKAHVFAEVPLFHEDISFMKEHQPEDEDMDELVIESVEGEESDIEVVAEDAEEINLDVLGEDGEVASVEMAGGDDTEDVTEITLGGGSLDEPVVEKAAQPAVPKPTGDVEEISIEVDEALGALEMEEPAAKAPATKPAPAPKAAVASDDEDSLLDSLEVEEEEGPEPTLDEDMPADEQTVEAAPMAEAVIEKTAKSRTEEVDLTPEEEEVLGERAGAPEVEEVEIPFEEESDPAEPPPEPEPPPPPPPAPKPAAAPAPKADAWSAPGEPLSGDELTEEEYETLARLLAMM